MASSTEIREELNRFIWQRGSTITGRADHFRLTLRPRDRDFFRDHVQKDGAVKDLVEKDPAGFADTRRRVHENARYFWEELSSLSEAEREALAAYLIQHCYLVVVAASDRSAAYRIFAVMNDRGLDLSPTDILKAEIIGALPEAQRDVYTEAWENIEEELGRGRFRELFGHIRMLHARIKAKGNLTDEFMRDVADHFAPNALIDDEIGPLAEAFQIVRDAVFEATQGAESVNVPLVQLSRLDNADWVPPTMGFVRAYGNDPACLARLLTDLERLSYGLLLLGANVTSRVARHGRLLRDLSDGNDPFEDGSALQLDPDEQIRIIEAIDGPLYWRQRVCLPVLLRLDSLMADAGARYEHKVISIEHVLPQTPKPGSRWIEWFPEYDDRQTWTQRLGNLVLLSRRKNTAAQNFDFDRKRETYFKKGGVAPFALTADVLNSDSWTREHLAERHERLKGMLTSHWRLKRD
ncbi:DUF262 domain-containing protein [Rhodobacteraceae bacterium SC52]|nr:DUF262 domain-containing protein [Rhodobacteraceae bacterium SC52]